MGMSPSSRCWPLMCCITLVALSANDGLPVKRLSSLNSSWIDDTSATPLHGLL